MRVQFLCGWAKTNVEQRSRTVGEVAPLLFLLKRWLFHIVCQFTFFQGLPNNTIINLFLYQLKRFFLAFGQIFFRKLKDTFFS
jgi:hypothetical protein